MKYLRQWRFLRWTVKEAFRLGTRYKGRPLCVDDVRLFTIWSCVWHNNCNQSMCWMFHETAIIWKSRLWAATLKWKMQRITLPVAGGWICLRIKQKNMLLMGAICGGVASQLRKLQEKERQKRSGESFYEAEHRRLSVLADMEAGKGVRADKNFWMIRNRHTGKRFRCWNSRFMNMQEPRSILIPISAGRYFVWDAGSSGWKRQEGLQYQCRYSWKIRDKHPIT